MMIFVLLIQGHRRGLRITNEVKSIDNQGNLIKRDGSVRIEPSRLLLRLLVGLGGMGRCEGFVTRG
jgi:hypothetical protein